MRQHNQIFHSTSEEKCLQLTYLLRAINALACTATHEKESEQRIMTNTEIKQSHIAWEQSLKLAANNSTLAEDLLRMFVEELGPTRDALQANFQANDWDMLCKSTHKIHGASCYCGVPLLKNAAESLEHHLKSNQNEQEVPALLTTLLEEIQAVEEAYATGNFKIHD